ncbi:MAG: NTP transferase domain-containing protein [Myxococcales bacterium]|nr:NTP transferase domain-containing protein [Myxococcales bacterium]
MPLAAVVLAAGASSRMGRPKALLRWRGRPFVHHAIALARAAGAHPVVVVEGAVALPDEALAGAIRARNEAWAEGPLRSLQAGLRALADAGPPDAAVLVLTVDRPHVRAETVRALADAHAADPAAIWQPRHGARRGHPIVHPAELVPALVELRPPQTPRTLLARPEVAARRRFVDVDDPAVLDNLDRPEDLERLPP